MSGIFNNPTKHSNPKVVELTREDCTELDEHFRNIEKSMHGLTKSQQEDVISYWDVVSNTIMEILQYLQKKFTEILECLRQGYRLMKDTIKEWMKFISNGIREMLQ
ncbi:unnamed protein product [Brachionus calyciflorus]|uniref:Plasmodium RESA N-terminal domain-containing protein n=1 Tax=Brachionus calyciflorus TaxID=104777 RepID=A0A814IFD5_9BILA|nr:unnamed protein product [Brachionus calyciflorus]